MPDVDVFISESVENVAVTVAPVTEDVQVAVTETVEHVTITATEQTQGATITGTTTFASIPDIAGNPVTNSMVEYNNLATGITGGIIIYPRTLPTNGYTEIQISQQDIISIDSLGNPSSILTVAARPSSGGNATVTAALSWREIY